MAKIVVYGDIDISALYLKINGGKEITVTGKYPKTFTVAAGTNHIFATTVTKIERIGNNFSDGGFLSTVTASVQNSTNTTLSGELDFDENDVLLLEVKQKGLKTVIYNKLVSAAEADEYVNMNAAVEYGEKEPGQKNKWVALLLCVFFGSLGVHRFYEGKIGTGILYLLTLGLFGIGVFIDFFKILFRKA